MTDTKELKVEVAPDKLPCAYFTDIRQVIIKYIQQADVVEGATGWFGCPLILDALAKTSRSEVVVGERPTQTILRTAEADDIKFYHLPRDDTTESMMHSKFLVFSRLEVKESVPYAVITGSFNFTKSNHVENIVYIPGELIARQYHTEFCRLKELSTKLQA